MTAINLDLEPLDLEKYTEPLLFPNINWQQFKAMEPLLDVAGVRLSYLDGVLEIRRMPGKKHEIVKKRIAALVEVYLEFAEFDYTPTGSVTLESEAGRVKREADESYELGPDKVRPDLAIEIVVTSGGINKLEAYQRLQIPEIWFWQKENLSIYALRSEGYVQIQRSEGLPNLNISLLEQCINLPNHVQAVKVFRQALQ
jgi:Uma2 family endonuclease